MAAMPRTKAGKTAKFFFKLKTPKCENTTIIADARSRLERPANCKTEHRPFFEVGERLPEVHHGIDECVLVGERRAVGHDGWLEDLADHRRVVSPVEAEGRVHHGEHHLKLHAGGHANLLRTRSDTP